jgi:hypothetical protein
VSEFPPGDIFPPAQVIVPSISGGRIILRFAFVRRKIVVNPMQFSP